VTNTNHPSAHYDDRAQRYADAFQDETLTMFPVDRNMIRMLVDLVGGHPRVLDAGCGAGQVTKMLSNWGCDAVGVDAAEKLIELARTAYPGLAFTVGDLRALPPTSHLTPSFLATPSSTPHRMRCRRSSPSSRVSCAPVGACSLSSNRRVPRRPMPSPTPLPPRGHGTPTSSGRCWVTLVSSNVRGSSVLRSLT